MKGLFTKDLELLFQRKQTMLIFLVVCITMAFTMDEAFVVGYMSFLAAIFAVSTISYDEVNNGMCFIMTLPITRKQYALSKYVIGGVLSLVAWLISFVLMNVVTLLKGVEVNLLENFVIALSFIPMSLFILDVMIPLQLKYGAEKSRIASALLFGSIMVLTIVVGKIFDGTSAMTSLVSIFNSISDAVFMIGIVLICVAGTVLSINVSTKIMEKKTF